VAETPSAHNSGPARLEAISDGVISIAITLLVLEIEVPSEKGNSDLLRALANQWPSYFGYALSFITVGILWANHHQMFQDIDHVDDVMLVLNLLLLMGISFIPFTTGVLAEHLETQDGRFVATLFYGGCFLFTAVLFNVMWHYAAWKRRLLRTEVTDKRIHRRTIRFIFGPIFYGVTLPLAIVSPLVSLAVYVLLAVVYLAPIEK
jgi:uncharacterized membrane protein